MSNQNVKMIANKGVKTDKTNDKGYPIYEDKITCFQKKVQKNDGGEFEVLEISVNKDYLKNLMQEQEKKEKETNKEYASYYLSCNWNKKYSVYELGTVAKEPEIKEIKPEDLPF